VLRYDPRGHAESDTPPGPYSPDDGVGDVAGLWDALGVERSHVVGLGFGGSTTIGIGIAHPARTISLVPCCCRVEMTEDFAANWHQRLKMVDEIGMEGLAAATAERWFTEPFRRKSPEVIEEVRRMFLRTTETGYRGFVAAFLALDYRAGFDGIKVPTLLIGGGEDHAGGPREIMAEMAKALPNARHQVIEGAGHICNIENVEAFNAAVAAFLGEHRER
ncbi:MAG: alpha/beta fold hydrolase, partial [Proteobacteria bacterium]|nr:alpha/beta fold hydrolase [Pseudomonadota bacterium]